MNISLDVVIFLCCCDSVSNILVNCIHRFLPEQVTLELRMLS